jgi:hypothetical protein
MKITIFQNTDGDGKCGKLACRTCNPTINRKRAPLPVKMKPFDKVREHM